MKYVLSSLHADNVPGLLDGVDTREAWEAERSRIMSEWKRLLGNPPVEGLHDKRGSGGGFERLAETQEENHRRLKIAYDSLDGDRITAYLLLPNRSGVETGKRPAVLALHPTSPNGKDDVSLASGRENRTYGLELVSRGYVVLAPDSITAGERIYPGAEAYQTAPFYAQYPEWTAVGKMLADHIRAVDILASLPEADGSRIGAIGHSLGGYNGWFLAGVDPRVRAVVSSCGFSMFAGDPDPNRWGQRDWFSHFPVVTGMLGEGRIPFEWHEIAALAAPVPLFMWSGIGDRIFPNWSAIAAGMADLAGLYRFLGQDERFEFWMGPAGHDFPAKVRQMAYEFLDRHLLTKPS
ncbi:alpha/beta hydrolase family protein [Paenibacillus sp. MBLB4367]|uniref:alpha/beta hydrolase family protein n=1 Tax=Paenibacillus sp. MBLB4367 TaxID=3384767 RepID=UPI003907F953